MLNLLILLMINLSCADSYFINKADRSKHVVRSCSLNKSNKIIVTLCEDTQANCPEYDSNKYDCVDKDNLCQSKSFEILLTINQSKFENNIYTYNSIKYTKMPTEGYLVIYGENKKLNSTLSNTLEIKSSELAKCPDN